MGKTEKALPKILIVDDSDINRSILTDILENDFEVLEARDGVEAVSYIRSYGVELALVLLDIVMPRMDGFNVLSVMNSYKWIQDIPVIMISSDNSPSSISRAYEMGATDFIQRPFDATVVNRRVQNTIMLYGKQRRLVGLVEEYIHEKEQEQSLMINVLSHIVEFRNGESGLHVIHIHAMTEIILQDLIRCTDKYKLTSDEIRLIATASTLHDVGKIAIDDKILNKPEQLKPEESEIMKKHSVYGHELLSKMSQYDNTPLIKTAKEICRWHHERYDGKGYPDGLKGDEIPISAQVVALADTYDALTSKRDRKPPVTHQRAIEMIQRGECGAFNPILLKVLGRVSDKILGVLHAADSADEISHRDIRRVTQEAIAHKELNVSKRTLDLLERERAKYRFIASLSDGIIFEIFLNPATVSIFGDKAKLLGIDTDIADPLNDEKLLACLGKENLETLQNKILSATTDNATFSFEFEAKKNGKPCDCRVEIKAQLVFDAKKNAYVTNGAIGKLSFKE